MFGKNNRSSNLMNSENRKGKVGDKGNKRRTRKRLILLTCLAATLLIGIGIGSVILFSSRGFASDEPVTVTFDSTGGSGVASQTVDKGKTLTEPAAPLRNGYLFAGWYYEEAPVNAYKPADIMSADTTLYAGWIEPDIEADIQEYLRDCDPNITFAVHSEAVLTDENLSEYIHFSCMDLAGGETLSVKPEGDGYLLYSKESLTPGFTYSIEILDTGTVFFEKAGDNVVSDSSIRAYNFTVYRENVNNVVMKAEPKLLSSDDVSSLEIAGVVSDGQTGNAADNGKTIYRAMLVTDDIDYKVGDIISLGNGSEDAPENQYYRVVTAVTDSSGHYIDLITPNLEDIYSELEIYYSGDAVYFEEEEETKEIRAVEQDMKVSFLGSKGYSDLCTNIATGIKESPTVKSTVATLSENNQKRFAEMSVSDLTDLLQNVEVQISIQKTYDGDYQENGIRGVVKFSTGDIDIPLDENINLTINLSLMNDITETAYGFISPQKDLSININQSAVITNHCNLNFDAVIGTSSGEKKINITEEIQNLVNSTSKDKTQEIVDSMNQENFFGDDLDYVEIFNKELGNRTVSIYEVLTIQFKLNFHVDIGMRVGLNLNFDSTEVRQVGLTNIWGNGLESINQRLSSNTHFTATLKGQIGIRAGFKAEVNFSMVHLNDVLNLGFTIDVGVYEEISGFVRFDYDSANGISLAGGLRSETGIYAAIDFTWMLFGWQDSLTIAEFKFPILTIGTLEFASEFAEAENAVTFDTSAYNTKISGNNDLLRLKYVDISGGANGVTVNIKPASMSEDYKFYLIKDQTGKGSQEDIKYASIDAKTGMISIAQNAPERLDFTVVVQYTKGCSLFTKDYQPITKQIHMTYMKVKVDDINQKFTAAFYWPDGSVMEQKDYYVGQVPVPPSEDIYENSITISAYKLVNWAKPWKEEIQAIYKATDYHMDWVANVRNISYFGDVYSAATGQYQYGLLAAIPSKYSEMPTPPSVEGMNAEPGWEFSGWSPALREVYSDYSYSASYKQDPDYSLCSFYVDGRSIYSGYVKKGDTPAAPADMSQYSTAEQVFSGWWPTLGPVNSNSQTYQAVFRKYVNVTFKNLDGSVLSERRILAGETPEAPTTLNGVIKGEESYYEKHFQYWMTDASVKLGPVYSDTIYMPVYTRQYLEVKTVFNAAGHAFADGTKTKEFIGTYAADNFIYLPQVTYSDLGKTYTVDYWQSTEKLNGSYVKLYMKDIHTDYRYNLTFNPVYKTGTAFTFTVRFDGGDQPIYLTGQYGDFITADMLTALKKASPTLNYISVLTSYGLTLPYQFGTVIGPDGNPADYINAVARFELVGVDKTFTFDANSGAFADGRTTQTVTAPYATSCTFNEVPIKQPDNLYTYSFIGWADEKDAATGNPFTSFVINGNRTQYAVYSGMQREYTVTFDANSGAFADGETTKTVTAPYAANCTFNEVPMKQPDNLKRYIFIGWADEKDAVTGTSYDNFVINGSRTLYAVYTETQEEYTFTFDTNSGAFADNETVKTVTAQYATRCTFTEVPVKQPDNLNTYTFIGWADKKDAVTGTSYDDFVINGNRTLYAVYTGTQKEYTVTFDLSGGNIAGDTAPVIQTYHYGETIVPPATPTRPEDSTNRYVFIGWHPTPPAGATVTASCTYNAEYRAIRIDGMMDETGIIVSDGSSYEDICVNGIPGYTYGYTGAHAVPTLTVTGDGLTFSGTSGEVYVVIDAGVTAVTFENLTLFGEYGYSEILVTKNTSDRLSIRISGGCVINNTRNDGQGLRFERPVLFEGVGSAAMLTIGAQGTYAVYCAGDFDVDSLELVINGNNTAIGNDEGAGEQWQFTDSVIRLNAGGTACQTEHAIALYDSDLIVSGTGGLYCSGIEVSGTSVLDVSVSGENAMAIGTRGDLVFSDFTGSFAAESTNSTSSGFAVMAQGGILFREGGTAVSPDGYDLGGTQVFVSDDLTYSSFGIWVEGTLEPASSMSVTKP